MESNEKYNVIGLMSGTSLDGLDIAYCQFQRVSDQWRYTIKKAETIKYPANWLKILANAHLLDAAKLLTADVQYGAFLGEAVLSFLKANKLKTPDFVASHGHTVFHQPDKKFTFQLGNGNAIYAACGVPVIFDFRSFDVILGGQGAPLVPAGDKFLFSEYDVCLNLGGISNLSADVKRNRVAFDISFLNMGLNYLASEAGKKFDKDGKIAASGEVDKKLLKELQRVYLKMRAKRPSLGREIFERDVMPLLNNKKVLLRNRMCTFVDSAAMEIVSAIKSTGPDKKVLCTGGGAFNAFLMTRLLDIGGDEVTFIIPDEDVVKFKEAVVFAFLGVLRVRDEVNCLKSVTGASEDSSSGVLVGF